VDNLFNKKFLGQIDGITVVAPNYYYPGARRSAYLTVGAEF
jgi:hypothetical protein